MVSKVYLDHHAATSPVSSSIEAMLPFFRQHWGASTSCHQMGQDLLLPLETSTAAVLESLGAGPQDKFYFFSSSAEATEHLYFSHYFDEVRQNGKNHILTTNVEEAPILMSLKRLEQLGCHGKILPVDPHGVLTKAAIQEAIKPRTSLVSMSWANGLTGVIHPIADIAEVCRANGVKLHVDASYVIGKLYFSLEDFPIDLLTFDGSFLHSPKGTGGLIVKEHTVISSPLSLMMGASVGGVVALAEALSHCQQQLDHMALEIARLKTKLEVGITQAIPSAQILFENQDRLPNCTAIAFPGVFGEALLFLLHRRGVYASLGGGHLQKLSHILIASGVDEALAQSAVSFSLSLETTEEEIDYAINVIVESAEKLKGLSAHLLEEIR